MDVIVAGSTPADPIRLLESDAMGELMQRASKSYDFIVLDTVPALLTADAMPLMGKVGGVLLVSRIGRGTTREQAHLLKEELSAMEAPLIGVVNSRRCAQGTEPLLLQQQTGTKWGQRLSPDPALAQP